MIRSEDKQLISRDDSLVPVRRAVAMMLPSGDMMGADGAPQGPSNLDAYVHALRRTWLWCVLGRQRAGRCGRCGSSTNSRRSNTRPRPKSEPRPWRRAF